MGEKANIIAVGITLNHPRARRTVMRPIDPPLYFGEWLRDRRKTLDLTQAELARRAGCSTAGLRKIETGERRPSKELAALLALALEIDSEQQATFVRVARGELNVERLGIPATDQTDSPAPVQLESLPISPTPFIGRRDELDALTELLRDRNCRLLTLIGPGGIGKTRLSIEVAGQASESFTNGVCFVPVAMVSSANFMVPAIADAMGFSFQGQIEARIQLINHLRHQHLLLVLDNMEHILDGVELIAEIISSSPGVKLVVTSRERLNLPGEWVYEIEGLPVPGQNAAGAAESYSSVALFLQTACRVRTGFTLEENDLDCIIHICRVLEGTPLGIELAAAWVFALSPREIADQIDQNLDFLATTMRGVPERQRSLRAAFDHSWNLLPDEERCVLSRLAVFQGGFDRQAAEQVAGASLASLLALSSKSLVRRRESGRYDLHEVIRQYALSHLGEDARYAATLNRHSDYYLSLLSSRERDLKGSAQGEALCQLTREISNIRSAWAWAIEQRRFTPIGQALRSYGYMCEVGGRLREGIDEIDLVVQALDVSEQSVATQSIISQAYAQLGLLHFRLGHFDRALNLFTEGLSLAREVDNPRLMVQPLVFGGILRHLLGDYDLSFELMCEGGRHARATGDQWFAIYAHYNIGYIASMMGRYAEGYELMKHSLEAWRENSDPRSVALGLNFLSTTLIRLGRFQEAEVNLRESIQLCSEIGDRWGLGTAYRYLGLTEMAQGRIDEAKAHVGRSLEVFKGYVTGWDVILSQIYLGDCAAAEEDRNKAEQIYKEALNGAMDEKTYPLAFEALAGIAELRWREGRLQDALMLTSCILDYKSLPHSVLERAGRLKSRVMSRVTAGQLEAFEAEFSDRSLAANTGWVLKDSYGKRTIDSE
jgi:predicted ATPase/DNA-binding XRE family transcriptional regulator